MIRACEKTKQKCRSIGFSEIDKDAIKTYSSNFIIDKTEINFGDITSVSEIPDFDFLFAGFPCQPFSLMGNGNGFADTRGTLFFHIEKIISAKKPVFFLLENVRGLLTHNKGDTYKTIIKILENKLGYSTLTFLLNSSDYGIPQTRRRVYILGFADKNIKERIKEPEKIDLKSTSNPTTWHLLEKDADKKYYLSESILKTILSNGSGGYKAKSEINPLVARPLCATMHKMHRACQDNYFSDRFIYGDYNTKKNDIIINKNKKNLIRRLTPKEAFRLHGFPDDFVTNAKKAGVSDTQLYRQAGNAITVNVVERILSEVIPKIDI